MGDEHCWQLRCHGDRAQHGRKVHAEAADMQTGLIVLLAQLVSRCHCVSSIILFLRGLAIYQNKNKRRIV